MVISFIPLWHLLVELGIVGSINFKNNRKMEIIKNGKTTGKITYSAKRNFV